MADAPSTPTFPYNGPFRPPGSGGGNDNEAVVTLASDVSTVSVGDRFTVDVRIATTDAKVKNYELVISYDPSKLTLEDDDTSASGLQIKYLDTFYQASENKVTVNSSTNTATISLKAAVPSGQSAAAINRRVAQITFRATATGSANVSVTKSSSKVIDDQNADMLGTVNNVSFTIGGQATSSVPSTTSSSATATSTSSLPNTGLTDFTALIGTILAGVVMIFIGAKTLLRKKTEEFWPE